MTSNQDKYEILYYCVDLKDIFLSYCDYYQYSFKQAETLDKFCDFLLEIIHDGSVTMVQIPNNALLGQLPPFPPYTQSAEEFVAAFRREYPTFEMCQQSYPDDPDWWWESEWWVWDYRTVEIDPCIHIEKYEPDFQAA